MQRRKSFGQAARNRSAGHKRATLQHDDNVSNINLKRLNWRHSAVVNETEETKKSVLESKPIFESTIRKNEQDVGR